MKKLMNKILTVLFTIVIASATAQEERNKEQAKALKNSMNLTWEANKELSENSFVEAEADYRKAISKSDENVIAPYNLGTAYYKKESLEEAFGRFKQAGEMASAKPEKHKAFHNMGNVFMKNEEYSKAVEAYKEALRNDPTDEETRYNLALAKALSEKEQNQQKDGEDDKKDQQEKEDQQQQQQDQDQEQKQDQQENQDKDGGDQEKEDQQEGEGEEKKEQPKAGDKPEEQKQPRPNQLSPQQIKNLLEAMQNEENKVQEKMNEKKVKGPKSKNAKDW
jgi:tetratricopeptide (TPR) repeat protein